MSQLKKSKRDYYSEPDVVDSYDSLRFGGYGGLWVNDREIQACLEMLPPGVSRVLDAPSGTGRLASELKLRGMTPVCLDSSLEMIGRARSGKELRNFIDGDMFSLPLKAGCLDVVFCLRFSFHTDDLESLLAEIMRVLKPGGYFIFDTARWSPRSIFSFGKGGRIFTYSDAQVEIIILKSNARVMKKTEIFMLPSYTYTVVPDIVCRMFIALEDFWPAAAKSRVFWLLRKEV